MSCIGKEVTSTSARFPVVDVMASQDIVTETAVLHVSSCNCTYYILYISTYFHFLIILVLLKLLNGCRSRYQSGH